MPIGHECKIGLGTKIWHPSLVNIYGNCEIGKNCNIGAFVEIGPGVKIGDNVRIANGCFIPEGVTIEDNCNIMPNVCFCNDKYPPGGKENWGKVMIRAGVTIGARSVILPGVEIGPGALIGAGSVVTKSIPPWHIAYGNPCRVVKSCSRYWGKEVNLILEDGLK